MCEMFINLRINAYGGFMLLADFCVLLQYISRSPRNERKSTRAKTQRVHRIRCTTFDSDAVQRFIASQTVIALGSDLVI